MTTMAHDLLSDPVLSWRDSKRQVRQTSLPGILEVLAAGDLVDFPRVRAHQFDAWCMFLTQLAAIALHRGELVEPRVPEDQWRSLLLRLTSSEHEPWSLVVDDLAKPAFMQPPVPEGRIDDWRSSEHPDNIDVVLTSKGHDVKASLVSQDDVESWIAALVTLQTMQGYSGGGGGYKGIARMNKGYGSRPRVGLSRDRTIATRFNRDVLVSLEIWDDLIVRHGFSNEGLGLTWMAPWDGVDSLHAASLAPHFIEVCRRVRMEQLEGRLTCRFTTSRVSRCLPEVETGDIGDPWIPVRRQDKCALTISERGFDYKLLCEMLFDTYEEAQAQRDRPGDTDTMLLLASAMARGQGKTEGLHRRVLPLTPLIRRRLGQPEQRASLGQRARRNIERARDMRSKVLYPALKKLARGEEVPPDTLDARVNERFFDALFSSVDEPDEVAGPAWEELLRGAAWAELQRAINRACIPSERWYEKVSDAEAMFHGCLRKRFPTLAEELRAARPQEANA